MKAKLAESRIGTARAGSCPFHAAAAPPHEHGQTPVFLSRFQSLRTVSEFLSDPITAVRRVQGEHGDFVVGQLPIRRKDRSSQIIIAAGAELNRQVLGQPDVWRTVTISMGGRKNHPSRRMWDGLVRMRGARHVHYRKLSLPPLRRRRIEGFGEGITQFMAGEVDAWPIRERFDLWEGVKDLMQRSAVAFLFGDDREHGCPMAKMVSEAAKASFSKRVNGLPLDVPGAPFARELRRAEAMEKCIIDWSAAKRGELDEGDLLSLIVNHPDEKGHMPRDQDLLAHVPILLGAAFETCQNAILWTLLLLDQHPQVGQALLSELREQREGGGLDVRSLDELPVLDGVVKESMRLIPPVPQQFRVSTEDTKLGGLDVRRGTRVLLSAYLTNRNPVLYPEPDRFQPDRWRTIHPNPFEYAVFSAGPRGCPGYWFGMAVVKAAVSTIVYRYRINLDPTDRVDYRVRLAISPKRQVWARLENQDGRGTMSQFGGTFHRLVARAEPAEGLGEVALPA